VLGGKRAKREQVGYGFFEHAGDLRAWALVARLAKPGSSPFENLSTSTPKKDLTLAAA